MKLPEFGREDGGSCIARCVVLIQLSGWSDDGESFIGGLGCGVLIIIPL
jgi:hypothetical protein